MSESAAERSDAIAVIGMAGRFPGADNPDRLWRNLRDALESVSFFTKPELAAAGIDPDLLDDPAYVRARGVLSDVASWDAAFFRFSPREAEILDPQQRLFLECAWETLEDAGYDSARFPGRIGVYAGVTSSTYWSHNLQNGSDPRDPTGGFQVLISNDKDYLPTRVSFLLDLRGPSVGVQTACSSSLVAVHQACQSLLDLECDMALAGGSSIQLPTPMGYLYQPDGIMSADGHNRSFDARGRGSVFGDGVGTVLLKRLEDALEAGDSIYAVIKGSAVNNDGAQKVGFTAPSVDAQAEVVAEALAVAGVHPDTITYVEAHGSATPLGDPIEVSALTRAFRARTARKGYCALGSVKSNLGHLYTASGVTALIKTVQALRHRQIPPSLHFEVPNPAIDFAESPFFVARELREWRTEPGIPRRAAINSLGIGGTNAHVIVEEAPPVAPSGPGRPWQILPLSARTATALEAVTANLVRHLREERAESLADVAWTLQQGRRAFSHRRMVFARTAEEAASALTALDPARVITHVQEPGSRPVAFLFGGMGDQYPGMGLGLYQGEPAFRAAVDRCAAILAPRLGLDIRQVLYPEGTAGEPMEGGRGGPDLRRMLRRDGEVAPVREPLAGTALGQPALFVLQYALASLWMEWGVRPQALIGYSLGEYVAACVAGVLPLEEALALVAERARLIAALPGGAMLTVPLAEEEVRPLLGRRLALAVVNGPASCVVSGPEEEVATLERELHEKGVPSSRPRASHAFHSALLDPAIAPLTRFAGSIQRQPPRIPYLSNLTGTWITAEQATDPAYWGRHMVGTVRFGAGLQELLEDPARVLVELGPGQSLGSFVHQHPRYAPGQVVLPSLRHAAVREADAPFLLRTLGRLWLAGVELDWAAHHGDERRRRVRLPTYPFERQRYWLDHSREARSAPPPPRPRKRPAVADWLYRPEWRERLLPPVPEDLRQRRERWLLLGDDSGVAAELGDRLRQAGQEVATATPGAGFAVLGPGRYTVRPGSAEDWRSLFGELRAGRGMPARIVHLWSLTGGDPRPLAERWAGQQELGFYTLLALAQAVELGAAESLRITVVADGLRPVGDGERIDPEKAPLLGLCRVLPQEIAGLVCNAVDVPSPGQGADTVDALLPVLAASGVSAPVLACRAGHVGRYWEETYVPLGDTAEAGLPRLRQGGVYLLTGGLGGVGRILASHLARAAGAQLVLVGRTVLPPRSEWAAWRREHSPEDPVSQKLRVVEELEALGAQVEVESADVADAAALRTVIERCCERFGGLHGVVHAAGLAGMEGLVPLREAGRDLCAAHFRSKVLGTLALAAALEGRELDFCLLASSLSTVVGGALFGPYASANCFLDAFAAQRARQGEPWRAVDWDGWPTRSSPEAAGAVTTPFEMTAEEGIETFLRALSLEGHPQVVVSTGALEDRLEGSAPRPLTPPGERLEAADAPRHARPHLQAAYAPASSELERRIAAAWRQALGLAQVGIHDNFFDLGGNSLVGVQMLTALRRELGLDIPTVTLFEAPTVSALARLLGARLGELPPSVVALERAAAAPAARAEVRGREVAVIGMAGRFPGAESVEELWQNLCAGQENVSFFSDEEMIAAGVDATELRQPGYVKARPVLRGADGFDARLFGYSPREAALIDPQQRVFLECAWQALEDAGYDPQQSPAAIGVFAGASFSTYLLRLYSDPELAASLDPFQMMVGNDKDSLPTSASYKLDLRGPSVAVQTHCSTSLVAVHLACQSLLAGECSMALAGGVSIRAPQKIGYRHQLGGQESIDGHTRPFDIGATGTVFGDGVGIVVLKPLAEALADGDRIYAVIKGSAVNNDGALKAGYTAPGVEGQARSLEMALERSGVDPATISYVEAHGSATPLGDPIEVAALTRAFRAYTPERGFCGIGSVKGNVGHLDRASGVTGLIKAVLALREGVLPPSLHFEEPNPELDLAASPFYVVAERTPWPVRNGRRRAAVSSLGMGGTNAHVVLEEAPAAPPPGPSRSWQILTLAAKSAGALETAAADLAAYLRSHPDLDLADVAFTLKVGRRALEHRLAIPCRNREEALAALEGTDPGRVFTHPRKFAHRRVSFLLPGLGDQYTGMALGLYRSEPTFRRQLDRCAEILSPLLGSDLLALLYPAGAGGEGEGGEAFDLRRMLGRPGTARSSEIDRTIYAQPATFAVEYALAQLWMEWGIQPDSLLGYSLGEYVAACLAGVLSLEDALRLVAGRARLIESLPEGAMLAVPMAEDELSAMVGGDLSVAAVSGPGLAVVAGPVEAVSALAAELAGRGLSARRLSATHAFHSAAMAPIVSPFLELLGTVRLAPPRLPYLSNVTGSWITAAEATDPAYWVRHLLGTVRFGDGLGLLLADPERILLEVGPGQTLGSFAKQHPACDGERGQLVFSSLRSSFERRPDEALLLATLGWLWVAGARADWGGFYAHERRHRIALPTYPFERQSYWLEPRGNSAARPAAGPLRGLVKEPDLADWFYLPGWRQAPPSSALPTQGPGADALPWLLLLDGGGLGALLAERLTAAGRTVVRAVAGPDLARRSDGVWTLDPRRRDHYAALLRELRAGGGLPPRTVYLGAADPRPAESPEQDLDLSFYGLLALSQAVGESSAAPCQIDVVTSWVHQVTGDEPLIPERATVAGPCMVVPLEMLHVTCRQIDLAPGDRWAVRTVALLAEELAVPFSPDAAVVALRGAHRWVPSYDRLRQPGEGGLSPWRERGVYLITGGLGGLGLGLARYLAKAWRARLVLLGRTPLAGDAQDPRARQVRELEELGAEVLVATADVADQGAMEEVVRQALERFDTIHGVLHAAGVPGAGLVELKTPEMAARVLAPKVAGTRVLDRVLRPLPLDFLALFSSVTAVFGGGPGQVDYCAANVFLGAFARAREAAGWRTVTVDWSEWQWDAWQEGLLGFAPELRALFKENRQRLGITFEEGAEALGRALAGGLPRVVVSAPDLGALRALAASLARPDGLDELKGDGPRVAHTRPVLGTAYVAPRTSLESTLTGVWQDLLGLETVGVNDDFFELGGHSLLATQLFARLRDTLRVELPLRAIFEAPTVATLASRIEEALGEAGEEALVLPPIERLLREGPLPLSFAQERFWLLDQFETDRAVYNETGAFQLSGALDTAILERTLTEILSRHEALRTTFPFTGERPCAQVQAPRAVPLPLVDLAGLPLSLRERQAVRLARDEGRRIFDLAGDLLFTAHLLRLSSRQHWLLLRTHHIASDGESTQILAREIASLYPGYAAGEGARMPPLPVQYPDFAAWQRSLLTEEALAVSLGYWHDRLAGAPPQLELPTDRPRPPVRSLRGGARSLSLPPALRAAVGRLAQRQGATLFMTLLAAFQALLARSADTGDVSVGTPVSLRSAVETEGLIGLFINTVVLRERLALHGDFMSLLGRARQTVLEAHQHQIPFERLVEELMPERGQVRQQPFFQVLFNLQDPSPIADFAGLSLRIWEIPVELTKFDLTLTVALPGDGIVVALEYLVDLFDATTVERWLGQYQTLLRAVVAEPSRTVAELPLLGAAESWQVVGEWAGDERPRPEEQRLEDEFVEWAERTPDAVVAVFESQWISYRELDERSDRLAAWLAGLGVRAESRVGILMEPGLEMLVAVLGVVKAGGAYVPLSLKFPPEQRALLLADAEVRVLLTAARFQADLAGYRDTVLVVAGSLPGPSRQSATGLRRGLSSRNAAYVIYTSGSTGRSKGVVVEHRQVLSHIHSIRERLPFAPGMRYALVHPLAVDGSKTLLFAALGGGGCLHVVSLDRTTDGRALAEYFDAHRIDVLKIAPSHLAALHKTGDPDRPLMPRRWLMVGGEASRKEWIAELLRMAPECTVCNHYGPTETAVGVITHLLRAGEPLPASPQAPLGRPLANAFLHILDRRLQPVPIGVPGEIHIGGRTVARGYLRRPDLTAEVFLPDPFTAEPGGRFYRTGDLARYRADGTVEFLGRTDFQVKVRGFRIELREIESHLAQHPSVHDVVVTARPDAAGQLRLVAYLVAARGTEIQSLELRGFLKSRIPEYMVPAAFEVLEALPRQPQGKVNLKALPEPTLVNSEAAAEVPRTPVEEQIAGIWCEVLGIDQVGLDDDFFALGGHSFLAMQLVSRLRQAFAVEISLRDLFQAPTIGGLAAVLASIRGLAAPPIVAVAERPSELPLSFLQERYWFIVQLGESQTLSGRGYRVEGAPDFAALNRAFGAVVARHPALRTIVYAVDQRPVQRILAAAPPVSLRVCDLSALPARKRQIAADAWGRQIRRIELPLDRAPLLVVPLLRMSEREHWLVLFVHHIAFDAWSWVVLFAELPLLYDAFRRGLPEPPLPCPSIGYADFVLWQRQWFAGEVLAAELAFWKNRLAGAPPLLDALADFPAPRPGSGDGAYPVRLDALVAAALKRLGAQHAATPFMTLLAVYQVLLYGSTGIADLGLATYATGRNHLEIEGLIGLFAGLVGLRTRLDGSMSFLTALEEVRRVAVEAFARQQDLPLQKLISELYPAVDLRPILQVMFSYRPAFDSRFMLSLPGLEVKPLSRDDVLGASDFSLSLIDGDDGVHGFVLLGGGRFLPATGERLARSFELLAAEIVSRPESSLADLQEAVVGAESERWSRKAEELQAASLQRLRTGPRRRATGSRA